MKIKQNVIFFGAFVVLWVAVVCTWNLGIASGKAKAKKEMEKEECVVSCRVFNHLEQQCLYLDAALRTENHLLNQCIEERRKCTSEE